MTTQTSATQISFTARLQRAGDWTILHLPKADSARLPSRGQLMVEGNMNGTAFTTPLEPDGQWSHWCKLDAKLLQATGLKAGDAAKVRLHVTKDWPEPVVPADIRAALQAHAKAQALWIQVTPLAHWEWIRWIRSTANPATRAKRIEVACSKLTAGMRRPCCWNRNLSTEPSVSKNGVLQIAES